MRRRAALSLVPQRHRAAATDYFSLRGDAFRFPPIRSRKYLIRRVRDACEHRRTAPGNVRAERGNDARARKRSRVFFRVKSRGSTAGGDLRMYVTSRPR